MITLLIILLKRQKILQRKIDELELKAKALEDYKACERAKVKARVSACRARQKLAKKCNVTIDLCNVTPLQEKSIKKEISFYKPKTEIFNNKYISECIAPPDSVEAVREYVNREGLVISPAKFFAWYSAKSWKGVDNWHSMAKYWDIFDRDKLAKTSKDKFSQRLYTPEQVQNMFSDLDNPGF